MPARPGETGIRLHLVSEAHLQMGKQAPMGQGRVHGPRSKAEPKDFLFPLVLNKPKSLLCAQPEVLSRRDERGPPTKCGQPLPRSPGPVSHLPSLSCCVTLRKPLSLSRPLSHWSSQLLPCHPSQGCDYDGNRPYKL